jgi:mercuric ion transport protein
MNKYNKTFIASLTGTIIVAICCFTPLLVVILGAIGLSITVPYLDIILLPTLFLLLTISVTSYVKWKKAN